MTERTVWQSPQGPSRCLCAETVRSTCLLVLVINSCIHFSSQAAVFISSSLLPTRIEYLMASSKIFHLQSEHCAAPEPLVSDKLLQAQFPIKSWVMGKMYPILAMWSTRVSSGAVSKRFLKLMRISTLPTPKESHPLSSAHHIRELLYLMTKCSTLYPLVLKVSVDFSFDKIYIIYDPNFWGHL